MAYQENQPMPPTPGRRGRLFALSPSGLMWTVNQLKEGGELVGFEAFYTYKEAWEAWVAATAHTSKEEIDKWLDAQKTTYGQKSSGMAPSPPSLPLIHQANNEKEFMAAVNSGKKGDIIVLDERWPAYAKKHGIKA